MGGPLTASVIARGLADYGILALGWILFLGSMTYIQRERKRYQDLVVHIIVYFTKIHMAEGREDVIPPILTEVATRGFGGLRKKSRSDFDPSNPR